MTLSRLVAAAALALALVALGVALASWMRARRIGRRLQQLTEMYWELKYQQGELRAQLKRAAGGELESADPPSPRRSAVDGFVPLTSLRR